MNYTKNYRLPQWVKEDRIMMDDFNAAMSAMESGMTSSAATANAARTDAAEAKQLAQQTAGAAFTPNNMPYAVGSYTGTDMDQEINVGFRPSFVLISGMHDTGSAGTALWDSSFAINGGNALIHRMEITDTGFIVFEKGEFNRPNFSEKDRVYDYIAFR